MKALTSLMSRLAVVRGEAPKVANLKPEALLRVARHKDVLDLEVLVVPGDKNKST